MEDKKTKKIFIAFTGPEIKQQKIYNIEDGFECWNLKKFSIDKFIDKVKGVIPPINRNVLINHYKKDSDNNDIYGITEDQFKECSWGLLFHNDLLQQMYFPQLDYFSCLEIIFLLNLYSPNFLYPVFCVTDLGIIRLPYNQKSLIYFHRQDQSKIFKSKKFVKFFKQLLPQSVYGTWGLYKCKKWDKEDWRLYVASLLYSELKDYDNKGKSSITWQREAADMVTILESLFTAGDNTTEIFYRLKKRIAVLIGFKFPDIEKDIKTLYEQRSEFIHGSFFSKIAKKVKKGEDLPLPDFDLLHKHKEYVRFALLAYLNLSLYVKQGKFGEFSRSMDVLEDAIIDLNLRKQVEFLTKELFKLLPAKQIKNIIGTARIQS